MMPTGGTVDICPDMQQFPKCATIHIYQSQVCQLFWKWRHLRVSLLADSLSLKSTQHFFPCKHKGEAFIILATVSGKNRRWMTSFKLTQVFLENDFNKGPQRHQLEQEGLHGNQSGCLQLLRQRRGECGSTQAGRELTETQQNVC